MEKLTIVEIAKLSGVAISTVSRVLNGRPDVGEETRRRVMAVVEQKGYIPNSNARLLKQKSTNNIALIVVGFDNYFLSSIVERVARYIEANGYACLVNFIDEHDDAMTEAVRICTEDKVLGVIFLGGDPTRREQTLKEIGVPCVFTTIDARALALDNVASISIDNERAAYTAIQYLIERGHRDIAVLGGRVERQNSIGQRYAGVVSCLRDHGMKFDERLYLTSAFSYESAYRETQRALKQGLIFTALFAMSDVMAIGAIRAFTESGRRVPDDISVLGFDGTELARYYNPALTTIKQPREELARDSVLLMVQALERRSGDRHLTLESRLIEGGSVRRIEG